MLTLKYVGFNDVESVFHLEGSNVAPGILCRDELQMRGELMGGFERMAVEREIILEACVIFS